MLWRDWKYDSSATHDKSASRVSWIDRARPGPMDGDICKPREMDYRQLSALSTNEGFASLRPGSRKRGNCDGPPETGHVLTRSPPQSGTRSGPCESRSLRGQPLWQRMRIQTAQG